MTECRSQLPSPLDSLRCLASLIVTHLWSEKGEIHVQSQLLLNSVVKQVAHSWCTWELCMLSLSLWCHLLSCSAADMPESHVWNFIVSLFTDFFPLHLLIYHPLVSSQRVLLIRQLLVSLLFWHWNWDLDFIDLQSQLSIVRGQGLSVICSCVHFFVY